MPNFEIIKSGLMTSIQDFGRKGLAYYAIPTSGVMDKNAARIAQLLFNKDENFPLIECTSIAPQIQFNSATQIAITGANFNWKINNKPISLNNILEIQAGDVLKGQFAKNGFRGYIIINETLKLEKIYNSYSTYTNAKIGGFKGRLLQKGDIIEWENKDNLSNELPIIKIKKGPEYDYLLKDAKEKLTSNIYKIRTDSNRMGIRLEGKKLESSSYQLKNSAPVLPGFIQLPPSGMPIIVLQDGQISGGYPRIAYVLESEFPKLNQISLGKEFKFQLV